MKRLIRTLLIKGTTIPVVRVAARWLLNVARRLQEPREHPDTIPYERTDPAPMVERIDDRDALVDFFAHVQRTWQRLGEEVPHWSVLSADQFKSEVIADNLDEFNDSGRSEVEALTHVLARNGLDLPGDGTILEYGCGVGRVTRWLAARCARVEAFDISASHLALARRYLAESGVSNARCNQVSSMDEISDLPACDFFYTLIVLQHNPPPVIELIVQGLCRSLRPGGAGLFQVPTYLAGYRFEVEAYLDSLKNPVPGHGIEMHLVPQSRIFELIAESGCTVVEVVEDTRAGPAFLSNTFLIRRPT